MIKKTLTAIIAVVTCISALAYLIGCLTPFISPVQFWPMAFLALGFPYLAVVIIMLSLLWLLLNRTVSLLLILLFFAGFKNLFATFALNPSTAAGHTKATGSLRVLTWNVRGFDNPTITADSAHTIRTRMFNYISEVNPDVLCLQEFVQNTFPGTYSSIDQLKNRGYSYHFITNEVVRCYPQGTMIISSAIFSKIPIVDSAKTMLGDPSYPEYIASADFILSNRKVRIYATHFKSINLFAGVPDGVNKVVFYGDSTFVYQSTKFEKLKSFAQAHAREALIVKDVVNSSPYPVVVGVDMNSVPCSYPYHIVSAGLQDAFKLNGWGLGTTMDSLPATLRIDFLFVDNKLEIKRYRKDEVNLSDHFPQFVDVAWKQE